MKDIYWPRVDPPFWLEVNQLKGKHFRTDALR